MDNLIPAIAPIAHYTNLAGQLSPDPPCSSDLPKGVHGRSTAHGRFTAHGLGVWRKLSNLDGIQALVKQ